MPRDTTDISSFLGQTNTRSHSTLRLTPSNGGTVLYLATASLTFAVGGDGPLVQHDPYLKSVGQIRQSLFGATDHVNIALHNQDSTLGLDVASGVRLFNNADAEIGRYWTDGLSDGHKILFFGKVTVPVVNETEVRFDVIDRYTAAGRIIAARNLGAKCPWKFKDPATCGYSGGLTTCNKDPFSADGCTGRSNTGKFGGWMWPFPKVASAPSGTEPTGPIGGDPGGGGPTCFTGDTLVTMWDGTQRPIRDVRAGDLVLCFYYDHERGLDVITRSPVEQAFSHKAYEYYEFGFDSGRRLRGVTPEHPLYVKNGAFLLADWARVRSQFGNLSDDLKRIGGHRLTSIKWWSSPEPVDVYNLTIGTHHTYFADGVPVHNTKNID